ncbi:MAG TPA: hypothetical protein VFJ49_02740 [Methyloceanibacter sp.]|nr:hypothetical protein [Methyloceanibacter sp.]
MKTPIDPWDYIQRVANPEVFSGERVELTDSGRVEAARVQLKFWTDNKRTYEAKLGRCADDHEQRAEILGKIATADAKMADALAILAEEETA